MFCFGFLLCLVYTGAWDFLFFIEAYGPLDRLRLKIILKKYPILLFYLHVTAWEKEKKLSFFIHTSKSQGNTATTKPVIVIIRHTII